MKLITASLLNISVALFCLGYSLQAHAIIKCQDEEGNWHMGDTLPEECVKTGHQEINEQGFVVDEVGAEKTDAQIEEAKKQAELEAKQQAQEEAAKRRDEILLSTFATVEDINLARDSKLSAIDATVGLANKRNEKFQADLDKLIKQAAEAERAGKPPSEELQKDIESLRRQISNNNDFIAGKEAEKEQVIKDAESDVARFQELKGEQ